VVDEAGRLGHPDVTAGAPLDQALAQVEEIVRPGDVLLTVGAGDVDRLAGAWLGGRS
jgi:UDP-N-acetylmuramate-alanine ligase